MQSKLYLTSQYNYEYALLSQNAATPRTKANEDRIKKRTYYTTESKATHHKHTTELC